MSRRKPLASRSSSSRPGGRGAVRSDGKVDVSCPQCGTRYRLPETSLDEKLECQECHRVFFPKTMVGKHARAQDHSKTYLILGGVTLLIIASFFLLSRPSNQPVYVAPLPEPQREVVSPSTHPRTMQLIQWAQAIEKDNRPVIQTHTDLAAAATKLELPAGADLEAVCAALQTHKSTRYLRELTCASGRLADEATMTSPGGKAIVHVAPKPGDDNYQPNTRGDIEVTFRMAGEQVVVTDWVVRIPPRRAKPDPSLQPFVPNKDIAAAKETVITDSMGTRKVLESPPAPVPHWEKASPELRAKADQVVAEVIRSADPDLAESPGKVFNRATMSIQTLDEKKAVVPRALNAMYELYGDVNANYMKLSQLDRALRGWTGGAHNFELAGTGDAEKDKTLRESCVRQWFAFWWRYSSGDLSDFIDMRENLEEPLDAPKKGAPKPAGKK